MPTRAIFLCLLIILCSLGEAYAVGTVEIKPAKGLILLEDFQQWLGLKYQFSDHYTNSTNSSYYAHTFEEIYHFGTNFSVSDPHLLHINLGADLWLEQLQNSSDNAGSSSGNSARYQYNLTASALDRSWHPVVFFSSYSRDTVVAPFSPTFNTDNGRNGIECSILKEPYRFRFRYERNTLDISGGTSSSNVADTFQASGSHNYRDIMTNSLDVTVGENKSTSLGTSQTGDSYNVGYTNSLAWGKKKNYYLTSQFQLDNTTTADLPQENISWVEDFRAQLGRALEAEATYRYNRTSTRLTTGVDQIYSISSINAALRHRLYESLDTRLRGSYSQSDLTQGTEDHTSEAIDLTYRKKLPAKSQFRLEFTREHGENDRKVPSAQQLVAEQRFVVTQPFDIIALNTAGGVLVTGSVLVRGYNVPPPNLNFPPDKTYIEGTDYTVDYGLGRIVWGPVVPSVPNIVVSFAVLFNQSVDYETDITRLSGTLSLFDNRYMMNAFVFSQKYSLISGSDQNGLYDTRIYRLQFQGFFEKQSFSLLFSDFNSGQTKYQYFEGWWQYHTVDPLPVQLTVRDRYTMYDATTIAGGYNTNTLSASAACSRDIFSNAQFTLSLNVLDNRADNRETTDDIFVRGSLRMLFNKLTVDLIGSSGWRITGDLVTRDDYVRVEVRRFF